MNWFWRKDVKAAYREVTTFWALYFAIRLGLLITLYLKGNVWHLVWMNALLGLPSTMVVLVISYVYGVWRLKNLKGPGIEEYVAGKNNLGKTKPEDFNFF